MSLEEYSEKGEIIKESIQQRKTDLYEVLKNCVDRDTNDYFVLDDNTEYSLTSLCQMATRIQSLRNNIATIPTEPQMLSYQGIYHREVNIYNKIQHCNNLLRYALKRNGINPQQINNMGELISKLEEIDSVIFFEKYVSNIAIDSDDNLAVTFIEVDDILFSNVLEKFHKGNDDLYGTIESYNEIYNNLFTDLYVNEDGDISYKRVRDEMFDLGYMEELIDIPTSITWVDGNNKYSSRPQSVTVYLYAGDIEVDSVVLREGDWGHTFENKPRYIDGNEINYNIVVNNISHYNKSINGFDIKETYTSE